MATSNLVLRTVYLSPAVDDKLRDEAYFTRTSKNDLIRQYIEAGMKAMSGQPAAAKRVATKATPAKKPVAVVAGKKSAPAKKAAVAKKAATPKKLVAAKKSAPTKKAAATKKASA